MNKQRLLNVAKALRESPDPTHFTMGVYGHACGTPACAFGHYAERRDLQSEFILCCGLVSSVRHDGTREPWTTQSVADHFGIGTEEVDELFAGDGCGEATTIERAAAYIERFVARKEQEATDGL